MDFDTRWEGTFLRVSMYKHLVLDILKSLFNAWLFISAWMCPLWHSGYQTVWLLTLQAGKHTSSSTTKVALVLEDLTGSYYVLCKVLTAAKARNTPAHDINSTLSMWDRYCTEAKVPDHYLNQRTVCGSYLPFIPLANSNRRPSSYPCLFSAPLWSLRLVAASDWPALPRSPPPSQLLNFSGKPI